MENDKEILWALRKKTLTIYLNVVIFKMPKCSRNMPVNTIQGTLFFNFSESVAKTCSYESKISGNTKNQISFSFQGVFSCIRGISYLSALLINWQKKKLSTMKKFVLVYLKKVRFKLPSLYSWANFLCHNENSKAFSRDVRIQTSKIHSNLQIINSKSVDLLVSALRQLVRNVSSILKYASKWQLQIVNYFKGFLNTCFGNIV